MAQTSPPATASASAPARPAPGLLDPFIRAFNSHDAEALGALWAEDGLHVSEDGGSRTEGRAAITKYYATLFAHDPKCSLRIQAKPPREISPSVVCIDGLADVSHTQGYVSQSTFTAILTKTGNQWLVSDVRERQRIAPPASVSPLVRLDWLVGTWSGAADGRRVDLELHWAEGMQFLMGRLAHVVDGQTTSEVLHIIGWDAEQQCVRSWQFSSAGGFAEGVWQPDGAEQWLNKLVFKDASGRRGSMIHVVTRVSNDEFKLRTIDREIDGSLEPNSDIITLTRAEKADARAPAGSSPTAPTKAPASTPPSPSSPTAPVPPRRQ